MTDPITDMLNQIRNAEAVEKPEVSITHSNLKEEIAQILAKQNFVGEVKKSTKGKVKMLKINLRYSEGVPALEGAKRISKPGQKIYVKATDIKTVRGGFGISIISTPKGLMTNLEAKKAKLGGEVLLEVW